MLQWYTAVGGTHSFPRVLIQGQPEHAPEPVLPVSPAHVEQPLSYGYSSSIGTGLGQGGCRGAALTAWVVHIHRV